MTSGIDGWMETLKSLLNVYSRIDIANWWTGLLVGLSDDDHVEENVSNYGQDNDTSHFGSGGGGSPEPTHLKRSL